MWQSNYKYLIWRWNELTFAQMPPHNHVWMARRRTEPSASPQRHTEWWAAGLPQGTHACIPAPFTPSETLAFLFECKVCGIFTLTEGCCFFLAALVWFNLRFRSFSADCGIELPFGYVSIPLRAQVYMGNAVHMLIGVFLSSPSGFTTCRVASCLLSFAEHLELKQSAHAVKPALWFPAETL